MTGLWAWFARSKRALPFRESREPYAILVSEVLAQQTRMAALVPYYERFMAAFPDVRALAAADESEVLRVWAGLGYYARARNLHAAARVVADKYSGVFPSDHAALRALPGVGDYTAGALGSIAFGLKTPAVDGNVRRVYARLFARGDGDAADWVRCLMDGEEPAVVTEALMELGALICLPRSPKCMICPVSARCEACRLGAAEAYPPRLEKPPKRVEKRQICLVVREDGAVLARRRDERLLRGMWEFPDEPTLARDGAAADRLYRLAEARHVFTHLVWEMEGWLCRPVREPSAGTYAWVTRDTAAAYAFPSAMRAFLKLGSVLGDAAAGGDQTGSG